MLIATTRCNIAAPNACWSQHVHRRLLLPLCLVSAVATAEPPPPEKLDGLWRDGDQKSLVQLSQDSEGAWEGTIIEAPIKKEVGKKLFRKLTYDAKAGTFTGLMIKPDDDDDTTMPVTVTLTSHSSMKAVVKKWFLSKTLSFSREPAAPNTLDAGVGSASPQK